LRSGWGRARSSPVQRFPATDFIYGEVNTNFVPGTFGYDEEYNSLSQSQPFYISYLRDDASMYDGYPYLFISAGSGGGSGYIYLNWIIVT